MKFCRDEDIITPVKEENYRKRLTGRGCQNYRFDSITFTKHEKAENIKNNIDEQTWNSFFKFCFEREPVDKLISLYYWRKRGRSNSKPFSMFVDKIYEKYRKGKLEDRIHGWPLYTINGEVVVDKVYLYEELEESLRDIEKRLGFAEKSIELPSIKTGYRPSGGKNGIEVTEEDKGKIREIFSEQYKWFYDDGNG